MILISAENVTYCYEQKVVLESISFCIKENEHIALLGKNGSGKSTLIKGLNRLLPPSSGNISFYFEKFKKKYSTKIYTLFSNPDEQILMDTVYTEIALGLLQQKKSQKEIEDIVEKSLAQFDLLTYIHDSPYLLSTGEKKKLLLATALSLNPGILILDEPFSNLDVKTKKELSLYIAKLNCTQIIAAHEYEYIKNICTKAFILHNQKIFIFENIKDILDHPSLLSKYELS